ncbi:hypothetical protein E3P96_00454 [Wallemia ichthyophaga]|nr:hypothetical protein E3P96_00454 [Wallemia ichthyophaga]
MIKATNCENFRLCSILCSASFLLGGLSVFAVQRPSHTTPGTLFTHWIADHGTLWQTPTADSLSTALSYYRNLVSTPDSMKAVVALVASIGISCLLIGLFNGFGGDSAWVFEAASLFLFSTAVAVYYLHALPPLSNIPHSMDTTMHPPYHHHWSTPPNHPPSLSPFDTPDVLLPSTPPQLIAAIRDIAAANLLCAVSLTGVLLFLAGDAYVDYERQLHRSMDEKTD